VVSEDPISGKLGARPRSLGDRRWLHPVLRGRVSTSIPIKVVG
jgi:hypothetical protein